MDHLRLVKLQKMKELLLYTHTHTEYHLQRTPSACNHVTIKLPTDLPHYIVSAQTLVRKRENRQNLKIKIRGALKGDNGQGED